MSFTVRPLSAVLMLSVMLFSNQLLANKQINNEKINAAGHWSWTDLTQQQYIDNLVTCEYLLQQHKWSKNIWPKENKTAKPAFSGVVNLDGIRTQVTDLLNKQAVLENSFNLQITQQMLQHDLHRMARNSRDVQGLKELFELFNNDAKTIAECISRPYLVNHKLTNQYNHSASIHAETEATATADLNRYLINHKTADTTANVHTVNYTVKTDAIDVKKMDVTDTQAKELSKSINIELDEAAFEKKLLELNDSKLQEQATAFVFTEILEQGLEHVKVQVLQWPKQNQGSWLNTQNLSQKSVIPKHDDFELPVITGSGQAFNNKATVGDTWVTKSYDIPSTRIYNTAVWTGTEMIVWGGYRDSTQNYINSGSRYNPASDSWTATSVGANVPSARGQHTAVWSGTEMIVWGGRDGTFDTTNGGRYNPNNNSWTAISIANVPSGKVFHTAVWSGTEMIVWGGFDNNGHVNTGGRYNPDSDSWVLTSIGVNVPDARRNHVAVWTGTEMIVWGGTNGPFLNSGGRYNPDTDSWVSTSIGANVPSGRVGSTVVWSGTEMIVWGGYTDINNRFNSGGRYNPSSDSWVATSIGVNVPSARYNHTAVWSDTEMIVWGGYGNGPLNSGGRYNPSSDSWSVTSVGANVPVARSGHTVVWSGTEMIVWGGGNQSGSLINSGGRYNPDIDSWTSTSVALNVPSARVAHQAVWTGSEMIVWAGVDDNSNAVNTGGRYNPASDSWSVTDVSAGLGAMVPDGRTEHTAVWSGSEMIIWGGNSQFGSPLNSGGRYNPISDSWTATSFFNVPSGRFAHTAVWTGTDMIVWGGRDGSSNSPSGGRYNLDSDSWVPIMSGPARSYHTAVWSGSEMIVWGGVDEAGNYFNNGSRYSPFTNNWAATSVGVNVPDARFFHSAVWSGTEMIVWSGLNAEGLTNTGGRYNPATDSWMATSIGANVPDVRAYHKAVWSGGEMIIWGGYDGNYLNTGGRYNPISDSWRATNTGPNVPSARSDNTAVWSDTGMIVWGGSGFSSFTNSLGIYSPFRYRIGGTLSGLNGDQVVLQNNAQDDLVLTTDGPFEFDLEAVEGSSFAVTVLTDPQSLSQTCTLINGSGTNVLNDVNYISLNCVVDSFDVGVTVTGLAAGNSVLLVNNATDLLAVGDNNLLTNFASQVEDGTDYDITFNAQPTAPNQTCGIVSGEESGTVNAASVDVQVNCTTNQYAVDVTVSGLSANTSIDVSSNGQTLTFTDNNIQSFGSLDDQTAYAVTTTQPSGSNQVCTVTGGNGGGNDGAGTLAGENVAISIDCVTNQYSISATVTGLENNNSIELTTNAQSLVFGSNTTSVFPYQLGDGTSYAVMLTAQPTNPNQQCNITGGNSGNNDGSGTVSGIDVAIAVDCVTTHSIGVTVSGLAVGNSIELTTNLQSLVLSNNTTLEFPNQISNGTAYAVELLAQPTSPNQQCTITGGNSGSDDGSGTISGADVAITVECVTNSYFIGGTISGLLENNYLVLQNNAGDDQIITANGAYIFDTPLLDEEPYDVQIFLQPDDPIQTCVATNNTSTLAGADVDNVDVSCEPGDDLIYRDGFDGLGAFNQFN